MYAKVKTNTAWNGMPYMKKTTLYGIYFGGFYAVAVFGLVYDILFKFTLGRCELLHNYVLLKVKNFRSCNHVIWNPL